MFLKKIIFLFSLIIINFSWAQKKKKIDTVYVYEKVIVHDTVYLEKPLQIKSANLAIAPLMISQKEIKDIYQENISKQESEKKIRRKVFNSFQYGVEAGIGFKNSDWTAFISENKQQFGENLGLWISRNLFASPLSLILSANVYHWNSSFDLDANKEDTILNGFYFTKDQQPLLFQRFNNKHFEYALQLKIAYEWKNIRPFAGVLVNHNVYKMQFLVPENNVLNSLEDFKSQQTNIGFSFGLQYRALKRFLFFVEYQHYQMKNISLKNSTFDFDIFKTNNTFAESKINFGISYIISKI
ncbi:MAG: hypothetical protein DI622_11915 [Chryseobacterium sp.]|uniref:hypothetical protein n=1 Tax=Chryseobacterium sp. TaxID=1871047 RepID=UPI000DB45509|nr:hypothetical protein [Chryseobacterium sp.]MPS65624.1 hypothetical protein [Chryseobacterium sp.]PZU16096.1 MAG: hypothetical protein DI622_11915 [Chryseobacterium sp.]